MSVAALLKSHGFKARAYHGGMTMKSRMSVQKSFMASKLQVVVATVAFGMGLDKQDIRAVVHYNVPRRYLSFVEAQRYFPNPYPNTHTLPHLHYIPAPVSFACLSETQVCVVSLLPAAWRTTSSR